MFKKENRLSPGIKFNNSRFVASPQFVLKEKENGLTLNRFGIIVSKKVDKRAVGRNKIKRFFRDAIVSLGGKMSTGHDILLLIKKEVLNKTEEENLLTIESVLKKAGVIKK